MKTLVKARLRVAECVKEDEYKDIVRVHWTQRGKPAARVGSIVKIIVAHGVERIVSIRGLNEKDKGQIRLDFVLRDEMKLTLGHEYDFEIRKTSAWDKIAWACTATDPAARIAAWIAVVSGVIGIIG